MKDIQEATDQVVDLLTLKTNPHQRRLAYTIGILLIVISLISLPIAEHQLMKIDAFQPAIFSTFISFEIVTAYFLYSQFRVSGALSVIVLSAAYLYSSGMSLMYLLTFPGMFSPSVLIHAGLQTAPWLYILWHLGFPLFILLYLYVEWKYKNIYINDQKAKNISIAMIVSITIFISIFTIITIKFHDNLPILLHEGKLTKLFKLGFAVPILCIGFITLVMFYRKTRANTITSAWLCIAILASLLDVAVVLCGGGRYSVGWYIAKLNTFVSANIVLIGMIYEFSKMYLNMSKLYKTVIESEHIYKKLFIESQEAERKIALQNEIIKKMAYYDELTELPNRRFMMDCLTEAMRETSESKTFSVFFMDLDGFKQVNDSLGHEMGDLLLKEVAAILKESVAHNGTCARWAGDEFILLIDNNVEQHQLENIAWEITEKIQGIKWIEGIDVNVSISIGIATYPEDGENIKTLLKHADQSMYVVKMQGKNNYQFYSNCSSEYITTRN